MPGGSVLPAAEAKRRAPVDGGEFARFIVTGVVATGGNVGAMWLARHFVDYSLALLAGIGAGMTLSFLLTKLFAFRSRSWSAARGEMARFFVVYGFGVTLYWGVSMLAGQAILPHLLPRQQAELLGVLIGAGVMTLTSYFGHRFYTYGKGGGDE